jgi:flagellar hook-basal body complex protein FliE
MIDRISAAPPLTAATGMAQARPPAAPGFGDRMADALADLGAAQAQARASAAAWEQGLRQDLASVMIDQQVASLGFQLALNVRNRALGAYRDIMNMPV